MDSTKRNTKLALAIAGILSGAALFAGCSDRGDDRTPVGAEKNGCSGPNGCGGQDANNCSGTDANNCSGTDATDANDASGPAADESVESACAAADGCSAADEGN